MKLIYLMSAAALAASASQASAAIIVRTFDFTAAPFTTAFGGTAPFASVSGSFTVTFDPAMVVTGQTGVLVNSLSIPCQNSVVFDYYGGIDDTLAILPAGYSPFGSRNTNGFALVIKNASSPDKPLSGTFNYSTVGFDNVATTRTVTFGSGAIATEVPEPASWAMMLVGFGAMGAALRRRRPSMARVARGSRPGAMAGADQ